MKVCFVRSPRYLWPIINESDNFLMPLGFPSMAAALRRDLPEVEVEIIDCLPLQIGWASLRRMLEERRPDVVGVGDETIYQNEGGKLLAMAKEIDPSVVTVAGGHFFGNLPEYAFERYPVDWIVRGEGERTIVELVRALRDGTDPREVPGLAYPEADGSVGYSARRALIEDLDELPVPAYDMVPMDRYAPFGNLWPRSATIEHSRGCIGSCRFCSLWVQMGEHGTDDRGRPACRPRYRTKSVERTLEEMRLLYEEHGIRYLFWIDATFNADGDWVERLCDGILERGWTDLRWWAFLRADRLIEDEKKGVLAKMVQAGLRHPLIGVERPQKESLDWLGKGSYDRDKTAEAFRILRENYPQVFRQGTFLTCIRSDDRRSMLDLVDYAIELDVDYPAFHPLTPQPGTLLWDEAQEKGWIEVDDFSRYDWFAPVMSSEHLSRQELARLNIELNKRFVLFRPHWAIRGLFSPHPHRRRLYLWFFYVTVKMMLVNLWEVLTFQRRYDGITGFLRLRKPSWYDD